MAKESSTIERTEGISSDGCRLSPLARTRAVEERKGPYTSVVAVFMRACPDHHCMYWSPSIWHFIYVFIHLTSKVWTIRKESECDFFSELLSQICGCQPLQNGSFGSFFKGMPITHLKNILSVAKATVVARVSRCCPLSALHKHKSVFQLISWFILIEQGHKCPWQAWLPW